MYNRIINFNAGPAALPETVLEQVRDELLNYGGSGMSVMEMSHRSKEFEDILAKTKDRFKRLLAIPDNYEILFLQGGASLQFSMVPMNLCQKGKTVELVNSGMWTQKALKEIQREAQVTVVASSEKENFLRLPVLNDKTFSGNAAFAYMCSNNTIFGTQFANFPNTGDVPLVVDMSSDIISRRLDINQFGLIFAGAQKNIGPSGLTLVIVRKDLVERCPKELHTMLQYRTHVANDSLYNTPPTFAVYISGLVAEWALKQGGLSVVEQKNDLKAKVLYDAIDNSDLYYCPIEKNSRSRMNVVFRLKNNVVELENKFASEAAEVGLVGLKGHRSVGGLRASIYNAQSLENIEALIEFMKTFAKKHA